MKIFAVHNENLNLLSEKSQPAILKISIFQHENLDR